MSKDGWRAALSLMIVSPVLAEVFSGSTPLPQFVRPGTFILLVVFAYGLPVLWLRETAARRNIGLAGLFILGLAYGCYNEGLLAKTFFKVNGNPFPQGATYGLAGGWIVPWAVAISTWHALHSVLIPILLVYWWYPEQARRTWMGKWSYRIVPVVSVAFASLLFFKVGYMPGGAALKYAILLLIIGALIYLSRITRTAPGRFLHGARVRHLFWAGVAAPLVYFVAYLVMVHAHVPPGVYLVYAGMVLAGIIALLRRFDHVHLDSLMAFFMGSEILFAGLSLLICITAGGVPIVELTDVVFVALFLAVVRRVNK